MKSNFMNYFKNKKLYQWNKDKDVFMITDTEIEEEFCLDKMGMDLFLKFNNPEITLDKKLKVKSGKLKATIEVCEADLTLPNLEFTNSIKLNVDKLKIANNFVSSSAQRPILTGVNVCNGYINATDSFYAYRSECDAECNITISSQFINVLTTFKGDLELKCNANVIACEVEGTTYVGNLLNGNYPDLVKIYNSCPEKVVIDKSTLKELLSYGLEKDKEKETSAFAILDKDKFSILGNNVFEADLELNIKYSLCMGLNRLKTILNLINEDEIVLEYIDNRRPVLINKEYLLLLAKRGE